MNDRVMPPAVVLVRPQEEGNVGAVARAMANMGLDELILVAHQDHGRRHHSICHAGNLPEPPHATAPPLRAPGPTRRRT